MLRVLIALSQVSHETVGNCSGSGLGIAAAADSVWATDPSKRGTTPLRPVYCGRLLSACERLGVTHIDLVSLDTEGAELECLKTLVTPSRPGQRTPTIDVLLIEVPTRW